MLRYLVLLQHNKILTCTNNIIFFFFFGIMERCRQKQQDSCCEQAPHCKTSKCWVDLFHVTRKFKAQNSCISKNGEWERRGRRRLNASVVIFSVGKPYNFRLLKSISMGWLRASTFPQYLWIHHNIQQPFSRTSSLPSSLALHARRFSSVPRPAADFRQATAFQLWFI